MQLGQACSVRSQLHGTLVKCAARSRGNVGKALMAACVLEYRNTKLAAIEARARDQALTEGVGQSKDCATKLAIRWTYATYGEGILALAWRPVTKLLRAKSVKLIA